jgi:hypothetical protein
MTTVLERAKTVHALYSAATVIDRLLTLLREFFLIPNRYNDLVDLTI